MPTPTSQGATVSWGGPIGSLTSIKLTSGQAKFEDSTGLDAQTYGSGETTRVVRQYDCTEVEPGGADVALRGVPPYVLSDIGDHQTLSITLDGGGISVDAYLESFDVTASVGEFLVGTARFRFTGY